MLSLITAGLFITLSLLMTGGYLAFQVYRYPHDALISRRLHATCAPAPSSVEPIRIERRRVLSEVPWLHQFLARIPYLKPLERLLAQANLAMPLGVVLLMAGLLALLGFLIGAVGHANAVITLGSAGLGGFLPIMYLTLKKRQRIQQFQRQLPDALELVARALRAGHAFLVGMRMVGEEFPDPIGTEFNRAVDEIGLGMDVPDALKNLSARVESLDMKFFVTSLIVQRETGGNLAEIIESISQLIRKRFELQGRIKALSAEGKLSAYILFGLPMVIALAIYILNPGYMALLWTDPMGRSMVNGGLVMMVIGLAVTKKMIAIKV